MFETDKSVCVACSLSVSVSVHVFISVVQETQTRKLISLFYVQEMGFHVWPQLFKIDDDIQSRHKHMTVVVSLQCYTNE